MNFSSQLQSQMENDFNPFDNLPHSQMNFQTQWEPKAVPEKESKPEKIWPQPKKSGKEAPIQ